MNNNINKILKAFLILLIIITAGTSGYVIIEGWSALESFYMTIITISTVGFREVRELSSQGKIFTVFLIFFGMGVIAYILKNSAQLMIEAQIKYIIGRSRLEKRLKSLKDHYIICGFGRIGKVIVEELVYNKVPIAVIEGQKEVVEPLQDLEIPFVLDDATNESALLKAGLERAKGLVAVVKSDADNLFIVMSARSLNPKLFILARAGDENTERKLLRAGADKVVSPYLIGGKKMAHTILRPAVADFIEFTTHERKMGLELEELKVGPASKIKGVTLIDSGIRKDMDVIIVAIKKMDGNMQFNPSPNTVIEEGDILIALGKRDDLNRLSKIL
ncbi:MAG TPA: potassium channel protein [Desulfobacteraceae bacterium]|nr:potassium channel protein [Desulfobacteraceae bacterium]